MSATYSRTSGATLTPSTAARSARHPASSSTGATGRVLSRSASKPSEYRDSLTVLIEDQIDREV